VVIEGAFGMLEVFDIGIENLIFVFFVFAIFGWVFETPLESMVYKKFVNRGFLTGPYVPIYALGAFLVLAVCYPFKKYPLIVFFGGMLSCTIMEYIIGVVFEEFFHKKLWDYEAFPFIPKKLIYKNRISAVSSTSFGIMSLVAVYFWGQIVKLFQFIGSDTIKNIDTVLIIIFSIDLIFNFGKLLKNKLTGRLTADNVRGGGGGGGVLPAPAVL
jgi:uncharacterized membrane protein